MTKAGAFFEKREPECKGRCARSRLSSASGASAVPALAELIASVVEPLVP